MAPFIAIILLVVLLIVLFFFIRGYIRAGNHKESTDCYDDSQPTIDCYWNTIEWVPVKADLQLTLKDSKGKTTDRLVSISGYDGSAYLKGFCSQKNSNSTFRIDRILEAINTETGEKIDNVPDHLLDKYRQSPEYAISKVFKKHLEIIKVLYYVGKADGQLRAAERKIIYQNIRSLSKNKKLTDVDIGKLFKKLKVPNFQGFKISFERVCKRKQPKQTLQLYYTAKKVVATHKTRHANEEEALEYMKKKMKKEKIWQQKKKQG